MPKPPKLTRHREKKFLSIESLQIAVECKRKIYEAAWTTEITKRDHYRAAKRDRQKAQRELKAACKEFDRASASK